MSSSGRQPTGAGHRQPASTSTNKFKSSIPQPPSPDSESLHSTAATAAVIAAVFEISPSDLDRITQPFRNSFIARIFGKELNPWQLASRLNRHLHLATPVKVFELNRGNFVLNFSENDYFALIHVGNPWSIPNLCIHAVPWEPNFKPSESVVHVVDVWIRLQELPIEYYDYDTLRQIAEFIGLELVMIDPVTKNRTKCMFGRICVKLDLWNPLLSMIKINGFLQEIEYEGFDFLCSCCSRVLDFCLCQSSGCSRFDPHNCRSFEETGSSSNSNSKQLLISEIEPNNSTPSIALNDSSMPISSYPDADVEIERNNLIPSIAFHDHPMSIALYPEANSPTFEVSVELDQTNLIPSVTSNDHPVSIFPFSEAASTSTTVAELEQNNLTPTSDLDDHPASASTMVAAPAELESKNSNLSMAVGEDKFRATETSSSTSQLQPSATNASTPTSENVLLFYLIGIERSVIEKDITEIPFEGNGISHCPVIYTIPQSIPSLAVGLSEDPNSIPKQNQFVINIKSSLRSGSKKMLGWKVRGRYDSNNVKGLKYVVQKYEPSIIVIFASRISDDDVDEIQEELDFYGTYCQKSDDNNRGDWLLMFKQDVETEVFETSLLDSASAYADTDEASWQTWGSASFRDSTYPIGNALAC